LEAVFERRIKEFAVEETIKITLFYSENLKDFQVSQAKESPALRKQGRANFLGADKETPFPPQQKEFVSNTTSAQNKSFQTFSIILPNLIHKSRKKNLTR